MIYESVKTVDSVAAPGVQYTVVRMSFARRLELMRKIRELARKLEYLEAGGKPGDRMDAALARAEIDKLWVLWGLQSISGLTLDGSAASPESLTESGPEDLFREALEAVRAEAGLNEAERKN